MLVRNAKKDDVQKIVKIHDERFSGFFLSTLGRPFLKIFYTAFLKEPAVLLVLEDEGEIKGFAAGSRNNNSFFKKLLKNNLFQFASVGIEILIKNPAALKRMRSNANSAEIINFNFAELLSIATFKNSKGYGKILLNEFETEIGRKNTENLPISLTTDYNENKKVVDFYLQSGYQIHHVFESYQNRKMYRFIKNI